MANGAQDVLEAEHDDIFLLRYVLSYKTTAKSETHVRAGIAFRKENAWLEYAKTGQVWEVSRHSVNLRSAPLNFFFFFLFRSTPRWSGLPARVSRTTASSTEVLFST